MFFFSFLRNFLNFLKISLLISSSISSRKIAILPLLGSKSIQSQTMFFFSEFRAGIFWAALIIILQYRVFFLFHNSDQNTCKFFKNFMQTNYSKYPQEFPEEIITDIQQEVSDYPLHRVQKCFQNLARDFLQDCRSNMLRKLT